MKKIAAIALIATIFLPATQALGAIDICSIPVNMNVDAEYEGCYFSCIEVRARANFEVECGLRIDEEDPEFMDWDVYFDGSNIIPGDSNWNTLKICVLAWNPTNFLEDSVIQTLVSTVTITVKPAVFGIMPTDIGMFVEIEKCNEYQFVLQPVECSIDIGIDIKPGSCPNPVNIKSKGVFPVAILGTEDFDVDTIDIASIRLAGVAPIRSSYEDVATPVLDEAEVCECTTAGPDGHLDLTLKFKTQEIVAALGEVNDGDELELTLTGALYEALGEIPIQGEDCIVIISKGKPE